MAGDASLRPPPHPPNPLPPLHPSNFPPLPPSPSTSPSISSVSKILAPQASPTMPLIITVNDISSSPMELSSAPTTTVNIITDTTMDEPLSPHLSTLQTTTTNSPISLSLDFSLPHQLPPTPTEPIISIPPPSTTPPATYPVEISATSNAVIAGINAHPTINQGSDFTRSIWWNLCTILHFTWASSSWDAILLSISNFKEKQEHRYLLILSWQALIYHTWTERNNRIHLNTHRSTDQILSAIDATIRNRIASFRHQNSDYASSCLQLWFDLRRF